MARGYVYILFNPSLRSNQFKIGLTTHSPEDRARELSRATGVVQPYEVVYSVAVDNCAAAERLVHQKLAQYRIAKEFFELPLSVAVTTLNEISSNATTDLDRSELEPADAAVQEGPPFGPHLEFSSPGAVRRPVSGQSSNRLNSAGPITFESHLEKTDAPRQEVLLRLRGMVKSIGSDIVETVTRANRVAYARGRVFLEVKVHKDRVRILFLDIRLDDPDGVVSAVPATHGWGRLKYLMNLRTLDDLEYGMRFVRASDALAR